MAQHDFYESHGVPAEGYNNNVTAEDLSSVLRSDIGEITGSGPARRILATVKSESNLEPFVLFQIEEIVPISASHAEIKKSQVEASTKRGINQIIINDGVRKRIAYDFYSSQQLFYPSLIGSKILISNSCVEILGTILLTDDNFIFLGGCLDKSGKIDTYQVNFHCGNEVDTGNGHQSERILTYTCEKNVANDLSRRPDSESEVSKNTALDAPVLVPLIKAIQGIADTRTLVLDASLSALIPPLKVHEERFLLRCEFRNQNISAICYIGSKFIESILNIQAQKYARKTAAEKSLYMRELSSYFYRKANECASFQFRYCKYRGIEVVSEV